MQWTAHAGTYIATPSAPRVPPTTLIAAPLSYTWRWSMADPRGRTLGHGEAGTGEDARADAVRAWKRYAASFGRGSMERIKG